MKIFARCTIMLAAVCCFTCATMAQAPKAAEAQELISKVPAASTIVAQMNLKELMTLPFYQDIRKEAVKEEGWKKAEAGLTKYGLTMETAFSEMMVFGDEKDFGGVFVRTALSEANYEAWLKDESPKDKPNYTIETVKGRKLFVMSKTAEISTMLESSGQLGDSLACSYLEPNLMLLGAKEKVKQYLETPAAGPNKQLVEQKARIPKGTLVWLAFKLPAKAEGPINGAPPEVGGLGSMAEGVSGGLGWLSMSGAKKEDIAAEIMLDCKDAQSASMLTMQTQMMMGMAMMGLSDKPQLANGITQAIKVTAADKNVKIGITIPKALQDEIKKAVQEGKSAIPAAMPTELGPAKGGKDTSSTPPPATRKDKTTSTK